MGQNQLRPLRLDPQQSLSFYVQIAQAIRDQVARGELVAGDALPTVRELARQLKVNPNTILRAYSLLRQEGLLEARAKQGTRVAAHAHGDQLRAAREADLRLRVSRLIAEAIAHGFTLAEIEAAFIGQRARWHEQVAPTRRAQPEPPAQLLGMGSHDLSLELLNAQFESAHLQMRLRFAAVGSMAGLMALARGEAHFAAAHLYDAKTGDYNVPFIRRLAPSRPLTLITLAHRAQGFIVARGNPKKIRRVTDLVRRGVRFVNRPRGTGTRVLLDDLLRKAHIAQRRINGYAREERTHLGVSTAVANGAADVGLGIQAAAQAFGLDFVPLAQERYEIILPRDDPLVPLLLDIIARPELQQSIQALGGYDLSESGRVRYA